MADSAIPGAPTGPLQGSSSPSVGQVAPWASLSALVREDAPEWRWPRSTVTVEQMLNRAQVWSLVSATMLPIEGYDFWLDPNQNDPGQVEPLAEDLGLAQGPATDRENVAEATSLPGEFDFYELLHQALAAVYYGHFYFNWAGELRDGLWRITDMAALHPATLAAIRTDRQGWLESVSQRTGLPQMVNGGIMAIEPPRIPTVSLIPFVYWPDATRRWTGRSMLRPIYQDYVANDVLARVDVINHERAGGIPVMTTDQTYQGQSLDDLAAMARNVRVSEDGGGATPPGVTPVMLRAGGTDIVASMRYHDENMARAWHSMVRQLGSTQTGSRALGTTMEDLETLARHSIAGWVCRTVNQWVCARWWAWNVGPGSPPVLRFTPNEGAVAAGVGPAPGETVPPRVAAARKGSPRNNVAAAALDPASRAAMRSTPPVDAVRDLSDLEVRAAVDFASIELTYEQAADVLDAVFLHHILPAQLDGVVEAITTTRSGTDRVRLTALDMARIEVPVVGQDLIASELGNVAVAAAMEAHAELEAQGVAAVLPTTAELEALVADHANAMASLLAQGTQLAASRRAVQQASSGMSATEVAADVRGYVEDLSHAWETRQLHGAVQQATNAARMHVFSQVEGSGAMYAISAVMDGNTCGPCAADDGRELRTIAEVVAILPSGGNVACEGGPNCRCTVVTVADPTA